MGVVVVAADVSELPGIGVVVLAVPFVPFASAAPNSGKLRLSSWQSESSRSWQSRCAACKRMMVIKLEVKKMRRKKLKFVSISVGFLFLFYLNEL
jgi:hypothetical protein